MASKYQKHSFEEQKSQLVTQYGLIPSSNSINTFIRNCFYNPSKNCFTNLSEEDRRRAYFNDFFGTKEEIAELEKEYYFKFPEPAPSHLSEYGFQGAKLETADTFEDLRISDLSIQILNTCFFEYQLSSEIKSFKAHFDSIFNDYLGSKNHQLIDLLEKVEERRLRINQLPDTKLILENINYPKLKDLVESAQRELRTYIDNKRLSLVAIMGKSTSVYKEGVMPSLRKIIDGDDNLKLYLEYQDYLIQNDYLDHSTLKWIADGGKTSFMRFYSKCEEQKIIKPGKRSKQIRILSDVFKIDNVDKSDYGPQRCREALFKNPDEFRDLDVIKSQFNLNSKNS